MPALAPAVHDALLVVKVILAAVRLALAVWAVRRGRRFDVRLRAGGDCPSPPLPGARMHPADDSPLVALARLILAASRGAYAVGSCPAVASPPPESARTTAAAPLSTFVNSPSPPLRPKQLCRWGG